MLLFIDRKKNHCNIKREKRIQKTDRCHDGRIDKKKSTDREAEEVKAAT